MGGGFTGSPEEKMTRPKPRPKSSESLDKPNWFEVKSIPDGDPSPDQADIDHLCRTWAEVGRAILARRREGHETPQK